MVAKLEHAQVKGISLGKQDPKSPSLGFFLMTPGKRCQSPEKIQYKEILLLQ